MSAAPASGHTTRPKIRLPATITTDEELYWAVRYFFGISIPRTKVCPDHVAPFTAFADAFFARDSITDPDNPRDASISLWHGSRGLSGKSFAMSGLGLALATFLAADVNLLGGSFEQSVNIKKHMDAMRYFEDAPVELFDDWGAQQINFPNGVYIRPLTASQRTVRGPHPPRLLLDEIDEMDQDILDAALGQPMEKKTSRSEMVYPYTVMCSTWQNPDGTFTEMLRRAEAKGWPIYRWCYKESNAPDGWLSDRQIAEKRHSIGEEMWRVEYDLGEPSIGNRAFDTDCVDAVFVKGPEPIRSKVETNFEEYVYEEPKRSRTYVVSADWGKEQDKTVVAVFDVTNPKKRRLVYFLRVNRRPWPVMIKYFNDAIKLYRCELNKAIHDGTGLGNTVADYVDTRAWGFTFTGEKRAALLTEYVAAIEHGGPLYQIPRIGSAYTEHKYCRVGDLWSTAKAAGYHLPDTVAAFALAHRAAGSAPPVVAPQAVPKGNSQGPATYVGRSLGDKEPGEMRRGMSDVVDIDLGV